MTTKKNLSKENGGGKKINIISSTLPSTCTHCLCISSPSPSAAAAAAKHFWIVSTSHSFHPLWLWGDSTLPHSETNAVGIGWKEARCGACGGGRSRKVGCVNETGRGGEREE